LKEMEKVHALGWEKDRRKGGGGSADTLAEKKGKEGGKIFEGMEKK